MWQLIITVALMAAEYFLGKAKDDKEMMELFYKFVERRQKDYLNSKILRDSAKKQLKALADRKPEDWKETT